MKQTKLIVDKALWLFVEYYKSTYYYDNKLKIMRISWYIQSNIYDLCFQALSKI